MVNKILFILILGALFFGCTSENTLPPGSTPSNYKETMLESSSADIYEFELEAIDKSWDGTTQLGGTVDIYFDGQDRIRSTMELNEYTFAKKSFREHDANFITAIIHSDGYYTQEVSNGKEFRIIEGKKDRITQEMDKIGSVTITCYDKDYKELNSISMPENAVVYVECKVRETISKGVYRRPIILIDYPAHIVDSDIISGEVYRTAIPRISGGYAKAYEITEDLEDFDSYTAMIVLRSGTSKPDGEFRVKVMDYATYTYDETLYYGYENKFLLSDVGGEDVEVSYGVNQ